METIIRIGPHTLTQAEERGANENEIIDVIKNGFSISVKYERSGKAKVYDFKQKRLYKYYEQKRIEVFFITVTVYVYYGKWEGNR
ncbi:hypothetical protein MUP95_04545 [bacterium]|nr:hypothetical protein [bacterium]